MRIRLLVTHTQAPTQNNLIFLKNQGIECIWRPALKVLSRSVLPDKPFDSIILSSPTSIYWAQKQGLRSPEYWVIGPQTEEIAKACGLTPVFRLACGPYRLRNLLETYHEYLCKRNCLWLGSHQGVLRYLHVFDQSPWLTPFVTHWNWPIDYHGALASLELDQVDAVIVSSQHAAISLSSLQWDYTPLILLSHERLAPYFSKVQGVVNVVNTTWIQDIVYTYYKHSIKSDYGF